MKFLIKLALFVTGPIWFIPFAIFIVAKDVWSEISEFVERA
jgi:hypothetical protein